MLGQFGAGAGAPPPARLAPSDRDRRWPTRRATASSSRADDISEIPGHSTRSVPSTVTSARDSRTMSFGRRTPKRASVPTISCIRSGSMAPPGRTWSAIRRASARSSVSVVAVSPSSAIRSTASRSRLTSRCVERERTCPRSQPAGSGRGGPIGAEVDEPERAVGQHEHVARVGIGVEVTEPHDLVERRQQQLVGEGGTIHVRPAGCG